MKRLFVLGMMLSALVIRAQGPPPGGPGFGRPGIGGRGTGLIGGANAFVTGAPFSAVEVVQMQESLAEGNSIVKKYQTTVMRDSQGRLRTEETVTPRSGSGKQPYIVATILDFVGRTRIVLDSSTMSAYQTSLHAPSQARIQEMRRAIGASSLVAGARTRSENGASVVRSTLAPQMVNGVLATGSQYLETIPAGQIGNERPIQISRQTWVSNDLKLPVQIRSSDPRFGTTVMELTNIVQGEPSAANFVVPAGYTLKESRGLGFGGAGGLRGGGRPAGRRRDPSAQ